MTPEELRDRADALRIFIGDAEASVRNGVMPNLSSLDREAALICSRAMKLPPAQAKDLQADLATLIGELDRLAAAVRDYRNDLKGGH